MEHCVSAFLEIQKEKAYKIYITDCLFSITNMYSVTHGGKEPVSKRWEGILVHIVYAIPLPPTCWLTERPYRLYQASWDIRAHRVQSRI